MNIPPPTRSQARVLWFSLTALAVTVVFALIGLLIWGLSWVLHELSAILLPVTFALILAYILDPVVEFFIRKKVPRLWSIVLVFVLGLMVVAAVLGSVIPGLIKETRELVNDLPQNAEKLRSKTHGFLEHSSFGKQLGGLLQLASPPTPPTTASPRNPASPPKPQTEVPPVDTNAVEVSLNIKVTDKPKEAAGVQTNLMEVSADTEALKKALDAPFSETVMPRLAQAGLFMVKWVLNQLGKVTTWAEFLIGFVLVPVYLFYFLLEKQGINRRWTDYLPIQESKAKDEIVFVLTAINDCLIVFFRGQVLVALCVGVLLTVGFLLMGLNYAVLLGLVAAVLGIVPYLGTITTLVLALTVAGVQFGDWTHPLLVLGIAAAVKLVEDFIIGPKIIGDRSGLHPLAIIVAVMVGTTLLGGVLGALFAIPLTAVLRTLMFRYIWKRRPTKAHAASPGALAEADP
jgi:predicted PurR-regulated permease PerM